MKKMTALLLALLLTLSALAGCGKKEPEGLFYDLTGIDPAATIVRIEGQEVPAEMYLYWVSYVCDYVANNLPAYLDEDGIPKWDEVVYEDSTLKDYILDEALDTAKMYMIVEKWAQDYGVTLSEETEAAMDSDLDAIAEELGGREEFLRYLGEMGITEETNRRMSKVFYLYDAMLDMTKEEGSPLYIEDSVLYQYDGVTEDAVLVDHILLLFPEDESERPQVEQTMEDLLATIRADEDPRAAFDFIADNYSQDDGRSYFPNGYLVTEDANFVQSFKDTALSLEEGEISDVITSEYGYHILMRKPLRDYVADLYLADLLTVAMENAQVEWTDVADDFQAETFYAAYKEHRDALAQEAAQEEETEQTEEPSVAEEPTADGGIAEAEGTSAG